MRIISPVYFKEIDQIAVSRKPVIMKALLLGIILVTFLIVLGTVRGDYEISSGELGRGLFAAMTFIELIAVAVFTPVVTSGMVCGEKEANTLGLLFLTRLTPLNIVQDKGLSRVTFMLFICVVALPFMFAAMLFGGVDLQQILVAGANILAVILVCGGLTMLSSTVTRRYGAALALAYALCFIYMVILPLVVGLLSEILGLHGGIENIIAAFNPYFSTGMSQNPYTAGRNPWLEWSPLCNLAIGLCIYLAAVLAASFLLKRGAFSDTPDGGLPRRFSFMEFYRKAIPFHPAVLLNRGKTVSDDPVLWKESNLHDSLKSVLIRIADFLFVIYLVMLGLLSLVNGSPLNDETIHMIGHGLAFAVLAVFTAIVAASSFAREKESGTFDVLLATRLTGRSIVLGTFWGIVRSVLPFAVILLAVLLIGVVATWESELAFRLPVPWDTEIWTLSIGLLRSWNTAAATILSLVLILSAAFQRKASKGFRRALWILGLACLIVPLVSWNVGGGVHYHYHGGRDGMAILVPMLNVAVFFTFIIALGMNMSLWQKTTGRAIGWTLAVIIVLVAIIPLVAFFLDEFGEMRDLAKLVLATSPSYWILMGPSEEAYDHHEFLGVGTYIVAIAGYILATVFLMRRLKLSFNRRVGRQGMDERAYL